MVVRGGGGYCWSVVVTPGLSLVVAGGVQRWRWSVMAVATAWWVVVVVRDMAVVWVGSHRLEMDSSGRLYCPGMVVVSDGRC